ncbi:MAG TPA: putative DNA-binding domain-containing protein [Dongiaceae bacterium]|nr:putative DNA-binding domain-containing protein [Dongiaceae bacterium]
MNESTSTQRLQYAFAAHLRDPQANPAPVGIEERRLAIYRDLFFNNIQNFLVGGFPVLHRLLGDDAWRILTRDFFSHHQSKTPYFLQIGQEFLHYLQHERTPQPGDPAFMLELAHYEWLELAADVDPDHILEQGFDPQGDLLEGRPLLSPLAYVAGYTFPVHRIGPDFQPQQPGEQPTWLIIYRDRDDHVRFMEINAVTARLLMLLQEDATLNGRRAIDQVQAELQHPQPELVLQGGLQALEHLRRSGIVLGIELDTA